MNGHRRPLLAMLVLALAAGLGACDDGALPTEPAAETVVTPALAMGANGATTDRQTFTVPFPPIPGVEFAPVPAPCLDLDEPLRMSGIWTGWIQLVEMRTPGRVHVTEHIDYTGLSITTAAGDRTWTPSPGASETIVQNLPLTAGDRGDAAFNVMHEFHARFTGQDGDPDLRVEHRVRQLLGPDGELRKNEFVPFTAECIGGGR